MPESLPLFSTEQHYSAGKFELDPNKSLLRGVAISASAMPRAFVEERWLKADPSNPHKARDDDQVFIVLIRETTTTTRCWLQLITALAQMKWLRWCLCGSYAI